MADDVHVPGTSGLTGDTFTLAVTGELDLTAAVTFGEQIDRAISKHHPAIVVLELAAVQFIDSTGLGLLVQLHRDGLAHGFQLRLRNTPDRVMRLMTLTRLDTLFVLDHCAGHDTDHPHGSAVSGGAAPRPGQLTP